MLPMLCLVWRDESHVFVCVFFPRTWNEMLEIIGLVISLLHPDCPNVLEKSTWMIISVMILMNSYEML